MVVTIHQPEHLPWLGCFDNVRQAAVFVVLDHVEYRKRYFQNRNRIRAEHGAIWLTVPVHVKGMFHQPINEVRIDNEGNPRWREKCWNSIVHNYRKAPHFADHAPFFEDLYKKDWSPLVELNETIICYLLSAFSIEVRVVKSSSLGSTAEKGDLMLDLCRKVGATTYLSGISGKDYLDKAKFAEHNIQLQFQEFHHPIYKQLHEPFQPCMSAIDLLFNYGPASLDVIKGVGVQALDHVFE